MHKGIDFSMPVGTPIGATVSGTVIHAGWTDGGFGNYVAVKDKNGYVHIYGHLEYVAVKKGQTISAGTIIGKSGNTGKSTNPHLHYEVRKNSIGGSSVDPTPFLNTQLQGPPVSSSPSKQPGKALLAVPNSRIMDYINQASSKHGVDRNLIAAIMQVESSFNQAAKSPAGAVGLMQLMPHFGQKRFNPIDNVDLGTEYIKNQLKTFSDVRLALAAYNAGPGRVKNAIKKAGSEDWNKVKNHLPKETRNYVDKVLKAL